MKNNADSIKYLENSMKYDQDNISTYLALENVYKFMN